MSVGSYMFMSGIKDICSRNTKKYSRILQSLYSYSTIIQGQSTSKDFAEHGKPDHYVQPTQSQGLSGYSPSHAGSSWGRHRTLTSPAVTYSVVHSLIHRCSIYTSSRRLLATESAPEPGYMHVNNLLYEVPPEVARADLLEMFPTAVSAIVPAQGADRNRGYAIVRFGSRSEMLAVRERQIRGSVLMLHDKKVFCKEYLAKSPGAVIDPHLLVISQLAEDRTPEATKEQLLERFPSVQHIAVPLSGKNPGQLLGRAELRFGDSSEVDAILGDDKSYTFSGKEIVLTRGRKYDPCKIRVYNINKKMERSMVVSELKNLFPSNTGVFVMEGRNAPNKGGALVKFSDSSEVEKLLSTPSSIQIFSETAFIGRVVQVTGYVHRVFVFLPDAEEAREAQKLDQELTEKFPTAREVKFKVRDGMVMGRSASLLFETEAELDEALASPDSRLLEGKVLTLEKQWQ